MLGHITCTQMINFSKAAAKEAHEVFSTPQSELACAQELCNMHKLKADAAQGQIRSLQTQLQSKQEQISLGVRACRLSSSGRAGSCAAAVLVTCGVCGVIAQADSEFAQLSDNVAATT